MPDVLLVANIKLTVFLRSNLSLVYHCVGCNAFVTQPMMKTSNLAKGGIRYTPNTGPAVDSHCADCGNVYHVSCTTAACTLVKAH